ncbi:hypothetical protein Leryth_003818 [Lithospermum erythrorhizon]|nr:hypothetical protein Leryth_003818 [Lithospermum erythrorhizon]
MNRTEGKTDYRARTHINQDRINYNTPRVSLCCTNKDIIAQIVSASITGDMVLASAYAHELPHYGLEVGLTNYSAAYCTGLLLARRVLKTLEMDEEYEGNCRALDGGLDIPHSDKRFAGFNKESKQLEAEVHRKGRAAFSPGTSREVWADGLEEVYKKVHAAIRADPSARNLTKQP